MSRHVPSLLSAALLCGLTGCVVFWKANPKPVRDTAGQLSPTIIRTPVKAHLKDGSTLIFPNGAQVDATRLSGEGGRHYAFMRDVATDRAAVPLDSVVGIETFDRKVLVAPTAVLAIGSTALAVAGTGLLAIAIFGSCPTVYADTALGTPPVLQAEGFSYAIAPLFEHRDVDALKVYVAADGRIRLDLRNEALETHFINHIELLEVRHAATARAVPDQSGHPVVVDAFRPVAAAVDRAGRDVRHLLSAADDQPYATASSVTARAKPGDLEDWIDISAEDLPPGDSVAVVLRLRNSLLNTVLLYEGLLGGRDAPDYLANAAMRISSAIDLSRWYVETMGMRATVAGIPRTSNAPHARLGDVGPIAFRDVALIVPRPARDARAIRVRLGFVTDNWRIDRAEIAGAVSRPEIRSIPVEKIVAAHPAGGGGPRVDTAAMSAVAHADGRYLETVPGQGMTLVFAPGARAQVSGPTTYFIGWQGYYTEWIRGSWLAHPTRTEPFVPGDAAVLTAIRRWATRGADMERVFYTTKIPVR